jgi:adenylate kinase
MKEKPDRTAWLKGPAAPCNALPERRTYRHRFVLLGAPGVGKGTQAELLAEHFDICPLSTGDVFRSAKALSVQCQCSPEMREAFRCMDAGQLVPDKTVISLVKERQQCLNCGGGFLLDGFPRTIAQAKALDKILEENGEELDAVLSYELPLETIVARLGGRRTCSGCKKVYHLESRPPKKTGICDDCGLELFQRDDDRPETIRVRMAAYRRNTVLLEHFYRKKRLLVPIEADVTPKGTFDRTIKALEETNGSFSI